MTHLISVAVAVIELGGCMGGLLAGVRFGEVTMKLNVNLEIQKVKS
jgi:hypothetical protein